MIAPVRAAETAGAGPAIRFSRAHAILVLQLRREVLRLAAGELEGRILRAMAVAQPREVVAADGGGVVLELDEVEAVPPRRQ